MGAVVQGVSWALVAAIVAVGLALSDRLPQAWDLSDGGRNSLGPAHGALLDALDGPIEITAFTRDLPVPRNQIRQLVARLERTKPDVTLTFVDPVVDPDRTRAAGIDAHGRLVVRYQDRTEANIQPQLAPLMAALERLGRTGAQWLVELEGPGSVLLDGGRVTAFGQALEARGYRIVPLSLLHHAQAPENTALLVLAGASTELKSVERDRLFAYLDAGGDLLWLSEDLAPAALADYLGVTSLPGIIVDAAAATLDLDRPDFAVTRPQAGTPLGQGFSQPVVLPRARALQPRPDSGWRASGGLQTGGQSWNERGPLVGNIARDPADGEAAGPLTPALLLTRNGSDDNPQRVAVIGDVDLLSDDHLGREANLPFGLALVRWLTDNDHLGSAQVDTAPGTRFQWPQPAALWIGLTLVAAVPLALVTIGALIKLRRRYR